MAPLPRGLEIELGSPGLQPSAVTGLAFVDEWEDVPELRWPFSLQVYDRMRKDGQVRSNLRALVGPVLARARWRLGTVGVDPRVLAVVETELGLTPDDEGRARQRRRGISFLPYAREAVNTKLWAGHALFEQVYDVGPPLPAQAGRNVPAVLAHLRKLAPRPPRTLGDPVVELDGGLRGWKQSVSKPGRPFETIELPIDRLVVHVHAKEGANWRGESALRPAWKHWAIRDVLMRVGAMAVERNGMGIPVVTYDESVAGANRTRALQLAKAIRAGDEAAVALPEGYTLNLMGVAGQTRDELPLLKYHGEMIGRAFTAMVLDLGHDAGARSLGDTFLALLCDAENALALDLAEEITEYVIRDLVALNFGDDEPYPPLLFDELTPDTITWADLAAFAKAGLVLPDDELEAELRRRKGLPLWPGYADDEPGFDREGLEQVLPPEPLALPPGQPQPGPVPPGGDPDRVAAALAGRLDALQARVAGRAAARR